MPAWSPRKPNGQLHFMLLHGILLIMAWRQEILGSVVKLIRDEDDKKLSIIPYPLTPSWIILDNEDLWLPVAKTGWTTPFLQMSNGSEQTLTGQQGDMTIAPDSEQEMFLMTATRDNNGIFSLSATTEGYQQTGTGYGEATIIIDPELEELLATVFMVQGVQFSG